MGCFPTAIAGADGTIWDEVYTLIARAFGVDRPTNNIVDIQIMIKACIESNSFEEFVHVTESARTLSNNMPSLNFLKSNDDLITSRFATSLVKLKGTSEDLRTEKLRAYFFVSLADKAGLLPKQLKQSIDTLDLRQLVGILMPRYDHSLDIYIDAETMYTERVLREPNRKEHRNDPFDLRHLCYLRTNDNSQLFVTTDNDLYKLCHQIAPKRVLRFDDFKDRFMKSSK